MKAFAAPFLASLIVLCLSGTATAAQSSTAEIERAAKSIRAVSGKIITSPKASTVRRKLPVHLMLRVPKGTTQLKVRLGKTDLSRRFSQGGQNRSAWVNRSNGLRFGANTIYVLARRGNARPIAHSQTLFVVRPQPRIARLQVKHRGTGVVVHVRSGKPPLPASDVLRTRGSVARRLAPMHQKRKVGLKLNGKRVNRAIGTSRLTDWSADLSATHGLRFGRNVIQATVTEPDAGVYKVMRRVFFVKRERPLASAGWDRYLQSGATVRLDGRSSKVPGAGKRKFRWKIVSKPRGSKASLRQPDSSRPRLRFDRAGEYTVALTVSGRFGSRLINSRKDTDRVVLTAAPGNLLMPFTALATGSDIPSGGSPGVKVGNSFYPKEANGQFQWLTLDRATLTPHGPNANTWVDKDATGQYSFAGLYDALKQMGHDQLVILSKPFGNRSDGPVNAEQVEEFNNILNLLGISSMSTSQLTAGNQQLVFVGVPYAHPGSGWSSQAIGGENSVLKGWLMPDAAPAANGDLNFRYQPERIRFNTAEVTSATSNTMDIGGHSLSATLPSGASGAFQVVTINPVTFAAGESRVFPTNTDGVGGGVLTGRRDLTDHLKSLAASQMTFAMQSIGKVGDFSPPGADEQFANDMKAAWHSLGQAMASNGANPHIFNTTVGSYAFVGGAHLSREQVADSSSSVTLNPTTNPPLSEEGTLDGRASVTPDGFMQPTVASPIGSSDLNLYEKAFTKLTAWPLTGSGSDSAKYQDALVYISGALNAGHDIRTLYWKNPEKVYSDEIVNLQKIPYLGTSKTCSDQPASVVGGSSDPKAPSYSFSQFCEMSDQLAKEFRLLNRMKQMFDAYQSAFSRTGPVQQAQLQSLGKAIEDALKPNESEKVFWSVSSFIGELISAGMTLAPEGEAVMEAWKVLVGLYEMTSELTAEDGGVPVGERVESKVGELGIDLSMKLDASADGIDRLRQVIASDWGRLQAVGSVAGTPGWSVDVPTVKSKLTNSAQVFFSSQLMPIPYGVHYLRPGPFSGPVDAETCRTARYGHTYQGAPESAKIDWRGPIRFQGQIDGAHNPFVLAVHSPSVLRYSYPPADITNEMFRPQVQGGFGMQLPRFIWESYTESDGESPAGQAPPTYIAYCQ